MLFIGPVYENQNREALQVKHALQPMFDKLYVEGIQKKCIHPVYLNVTACQMYRIELMMQQTNQAVALALCNVKSKSIVWDNNIHCRKVHLKFTKHKHENTQFNTLFKYLLMEFSGWFHKNFCSNESRSLDIFNQITVHSTITVYSITIAIEIS